MKRANLTTRKPRGKSVCTFLKREMSYASKGREKKTSLSLMEYIPQRKNLQGTFPKELGPFPELPITHRLKQRRMWSNPEIPADMLLQETSTSCQAPSVWLGELCIGKGSPWGGGPGSQAWQGSGNACMMPLVTWVSFGCCEEQELGLVPFPA